MVALLPRGGVLSVGVLDLLAVDLVVTEPALLTVATALRRGRGARVAVLGLGRAEFAAASQSGRRGGARGDRDVRRRARRCRVARRTARRGTRDLRFQINGGRVPETSFRIWRHRESRAWVRGQRVTSSWSPSPGPVPLGPASALFDTGFDWLSMLLVLGGVRHVEMSGRMW